MVEYYRLRDHDPDSYPVYVQDSESWWIDDGIAVPAGTDGKIPGSVMSTLERMSRGEASQQLAENRLRFLAKPIPPLSGPRVLALLGVRALGVVGWGLFATTILFAGTDRGAFELPFVLPGLALVLIRRLLLERLEINAWKAQWELSPRFRDLVLLAAGVLLGAGAAYMALGVWIAFKTPLLPATVLFSHPGRAYWVKAGIVWTLAVTTPVAVYASANAGRFLSRLLGGQHPQHQ